MKRPAFRRSNLDSTGLRLVRRGSVVRFPGGATCRVSRVRCGVFAADLPASVVGVKAGRVHLCGSVEVVR